MPSSTDGARFEGFADQDGRFFKALAKNQSREWFAKHKDEFEEGWATPMRLLMAELRAKIDGAYPDCELGETKAFRIYRDVRFSKDKSPYKTHVSSYLPVRQGVRTVESPAALYFQIGTETFAAAGQYMLQPPALAKLRASFADDERGAEVVKILRGLEKKGFVKGAMEVQKRVPRGFDPEHPRAELLRHKGLIVTFPTPPRELLTSRKILDWLVAQSKTVAPLVRWLTFATA
jgi:uncharacterized protein (TIGR02453 family)